MGRCMRHPGGISLHVLVMESVLRQKFAGIGIQHGRPVGVARQAWPFVTLASTQEASIVKHVFGQRIQGPVVAFSRIAGLSGNLDEAVIETEIMPDGVLPGGEFFAVVWEPISYEVANPAKRQPLVW